MKSPSLVSLKESNQMESIDPITRDVQRRMSLSSIAPLE